MTPIPPHRPGRAGGLGRRRRKAMLGAGAVVAVVVAAALVGAGLLLGNLTQSIRQTDLLGSAGEQAAGSPGTRQANITGPVNALLVGIDRRPDQPVDVSRADSVIVLHVTADHHHAYLISIPRDTLVHIPADRKAGFPGGQNKINAAFTYGSQHGGGVAGGVSLLASTITSAYGIEFAGAAVVDFTGFQQVVGALGGVDMCIDEKTTSIHIGFTKTGRQETPFTQDAHQHLHPVPGVTPVVYQPGCQHLAAWQALDYVRQRDLLANGDGDYGRQRHQQQLLKAIFNQVLTAGTLTNPVKLAKVVTAVGHAMTIDTGGHSLPDWIYTMRGLTSQNALETIKTNDGKYDTVTVAGIGSCERLTPASQQLMHDVTTDSVDTFLVKHSSWVARS